MEEKLCYVCSPYRGDVARNVKYAQELTGRAVRRGLVPITPHLYITQALDDNDPAERALGMEAGLHLLEPCKYIMIGGRYGLSEGMRHEIERAHRLGKTFLYELGMNLTGEEVGFMSEMGKHLGGEEQKQEFIHLLSFVERDGVQSLLEWLESTDFYTAPASTKYHGAYAGGLLEHSFAAEESANPDRDSAQRQGGFAQGRNRYAGRPEAEQVRRNGACAPGSLQPDRAGAQPGTARGKAGKMEVRR